MNITTYTKDKTPVWHTKVPYIKISSLEKLETGWDTIYNRESKQECF